MKTSPPLTNTSLVPPTEALAAASQEPAPDPSLTPADVIVGATLPKRSYLDTYMEKRFDVPSDFLPGSDNPRWNAHITFLTKTNQIDEFFDCPNGFEGLPPGIYRIREEGASDPLLTIKERKDAPNTASTIDIVYPDQRIIESLRNNQPLIAVIEKTRITYRSRLHPDCLLHHDSVRGLGEYLDTKADSPESMKQFLTALGLQEREPLSLSYFRMKQENGISPLQLKVWQFHQKFQDYIIGVVSGTLTPLGFLTTSIASGGSKSAMIITLLAAGLCDGLSDSVAAMQSSQSKSKATFTDQIAMFGKTMAGKICVPMTFVPIVLAGSTNLTIGVLAAAWAAILLASTAAVQSVAKEKPVLRSVTQLMAWGAGATAAGTFLGKVVFPLLGKWLN